MGFRIGARKGSYHQVIGSRNVGALFPLALRLLLSVSLLLALVDGLVWLVFLFSKLETRLQPPLSTE